MFINLNLVKEFAHKHRTRVESLEFMSFELYERILPIKFDDNRVFLQISDARYFFLLLWQKKGISYEKSRHKSICSSNFMRVNKIRSHLAYHQYSIILFGKKIHYFHTHSVIDVWSIAIVTIAYLIRFINFSLRNLTAIKC